MYKSDALSQILSIFDTPQNFIKNINQFHILKGPFFLFNLKGTRSILKIKIVLYFYNNDLEIKDNQVIKMAAKLDLIRNQEEEELCVFYEETFLFEEICSSKRNLHTLIVIGQSSITSLDGISELIHLRELWVVECQIKVMLTKIFLILII